MSNNPLLNAAAAYAYIVGVVLLITYGLNGASNGLIAPITALSLLVFSVLMMIYTLLLAPLERFFKQDIERAVTLFRQTVLYFGLLAGVTVATCIVLGHV